MNKSADNFNNNNIKENNKKDKFRKLNTKDNFKFKNIKMNVNANNKRMLHNSLDLSFIGEKAIEDFNALMAKLDSIYNIGCRHFAIFFDDITASNF